MGIKVVVVEFKVCQHLYFVLGSVVCRHVGVHTAYTVWSTYSVLQPILVHSVNFIILLHCPSTLHTPYAHTLNK